MSVARDFQDLCRRFNASVDVKSLQLVSPLGVGRHGGIVGYTRSLFAIRTKEDIDDTWRALAYVQDPRSWPDEIKDDDILAEPRSRIEQFTRPDDLDFGPDYAYR